MKNRVAILSMQRVVNFGSVLQAWSLKKLVEENTGASVSFMDIEDRPCLESKRSMSESLDYASPAAYSRAFHQRAKRRIITVCSALNKKLVRSFMEHELRLDSEDTAESFDCVIVGSDEVFNHSRGIRLQLHGDISRGEKIISYAASCGSAVQEDIDSEDLDKVRDAMKNFSALSLRDGATERYISGLYEGAVCRHMDPVLVGPLRERKPKHVPMRNYLLIYAYGQRIRTEEEINAIKAFAKKKGLKTIAVGGSQFWCDLYIPCRPFRLLDWFNHADYVITDTFHGIIFSVINHRRFAAISRPTNKAKVCGLLEDLGLEDRELRGFGRLEEILEKEIDYPDVDRRLDTERASTVRYLKEQLGEH